ncbi:hypothetical protein [Bradyrhizobium sp. CCGUVB23]|uniref:hypothetical protein n=1 Tax=Bradyrhizobium sp. CCGUVB23 TaxID=2949630 RepID=UPI0020B310A0|nr:hypothetical protein [Bradyrhizobium sp. CCGUVB23]MCP3463362.1 hypothetical protein [Bradyrhizobium sp. CCGUVB23]
MAKSQLLSLPANHNLMCWNWSATMRSESWGRVLSAGKFTCAPAFNSGSMATIAADISVRKFMPALKMMEQDGVKARLGVDFDQNPSK